MYGHQIQMLDCLYGYRSTRQPPTRKLPTRKPPTRKPSITHVTGTLCMPYLVNYVHPLCNILYDFNDFVAHFTN